MLNLKLVKVIFSGTAPGLFFMFVSGVILVAALMKGGVEQTKEETQIGLAQNSPNTTLNISEKEAELLSQLEALKSQIVVYQKTVTIMKEKVNSQVQECRHLRDKIAMLQQQGQMLRK